MKTSTLLVSITALLFSHVSGAQEVGRVLSSTPVIQQVAIPQQVCSQESVLVERRHGGGALIGAIAGGAIGHAVGHGSGRALGTVLGVLGGAAIGDSIEGHGAHDVQQLRRCTTHTVFESRIAHYEVVYEFGGRQYSARLLQDPGPTVQLQVAPVAALPEPAIMSSPATRTTTIITSGVEYVPYRPLPIPLFIVLPGQGQVGMPRHLQHRQRGHPQQAYPHPAPRPSARGSVHRHGPHWR